MIIIKFYADGEPNAWLIHIDNNLSFCHTSGQLEMKIALARNK